MVFSQCLVEEGVTSVTLNMSEEEEENSEEDDTTPKRTSSYKVLYAVLLSTLVRFKSVHFFSP